VPGSLGHNDPCHCGSGKKYRQCHLVKDESAERDAHAKAAPSTPPRGKTHQPWKRTTQNTRGFQKVAGMRHLGGG
jgi:hypothetical protein